MTAAPATIVYVAYWGLLEPLGRSLIAPSVRLLARRGMRVALVTFEKPADLADAAAVGAARSELEAFGVRWIPLRYHKRPTVPATLFDIAHGALRVLALGRPRLVHARTFVGGVIGWLVASLLRVPLVYHNEGFWPEQQVEGGFWPAGGLLHRVTGRIDRFLYEHSDALLLLSRRSLPVVEALPGVRRRRPPIGIVPSSVDLERFRCARRGEAPRERRLVYIGSLGGRYRIEPLARFLLAVRRRDPAWRLEVLSQSDPGMIAASLLGAGAAQDAWRVRRVPHEEVPRDLCAADVGLFFLAGGIGAESCSPTKVGEYWACGLPVVSSAGIGDTEEVIRNRRVGVVVPDLTPAALDSAASEILELLTDPDLARRCRNTAEETYSLERAVRDQLRIYEELLGTSSSASEG